MHLRPAIFATVVCLASAVPAWSQDRYADDSKGDIPATWHAPRIDADYVRREVMIPMRDGVKLHTVIVVPARATSLPMLLDRTPYDANDDVAQDKPHLRDAVFPETRDFVDDGYIIVSQDVRGKYGSQGVYTMTRPPIGPLNTSRTDDTTDAYDTIDWLVKNVPQSNGRVGMIGSSYDGWTVAMALRHPHPALKVASPQSPMVDGWMGDDWFHNGAYRQMNFDYFSRQTTRKGTGALVPRAGADDYQEFLDAGSAGAYADAHGFKALPWWTRLSGHPSYDAFWQDQALDRLLADQPSTVPTIWLQGLFDQEDIYGAVHAFEALHAKGHGENNHLVLGPWWHSQVTGKGESVGPLKWRGDTAADFRHDVLVPFFDTYLKDRIPDRTIPAVLAFNPADKRWEELARWPAVVHLTPFYLADSNGLSTQQPGDGSDSFISDPAKPVPFEPLPVRFSDHASWATWLVADQRFVSTRPDVLSYQTPVLDQPLELHGNPVADIYAKTTGTDFDVVVKVIDVYPPTFPEQPEMAGYQLPISIDIFRGRYRRSFETPSPVPAGETQEYKFRLPPVNYTVKPGHRVMVQVQSSLFPLYDRNPQTYVSNIFFAKTPDYQKATISIMRGVNGPSAVLLPVGPPDDNHDNGTR